VKAEKKRFINLHELPKKHRHEKARTLKMAEIKLHLISKKSFFSASFFFYLTLTKSLESPGIDLKLIKLLKIYQRTEKRKKPWRRKTRSMKCAR
jgi:hypothetical protein